MRAFDNFEKQILNDLKKLNDNCDGVNFSTLITSFCQNKSFKIDHFHKKVSVLFIAQDYKHITDNEVATQALLTEETKKICYQVIKLIMLLSYLEKEGVIYSYDEEDRRAGFTTLGNNEIEYNSLTYNIAEGKMNNIFIDNIGKKIFPSQGLLEYITLGFVDQASAILEKNLTIAEVNLEITRQSIAEHKITIEKLEENILESQYLIEDAISSSKREMKYSDIALAVAVIAGLAGSIIASVTAYYSFSQIGTHTRSITEKVKPISNKLTRMDLEFAAIRAKMDNIKITDTIHTRVVNLHE